MNPPSAYGTKSLGEPPVCSVAPAIRNAVLQATGEAIDEIPLTPMYYSAGSEKKGWSDLVLMKGRI